MDTIGKHSEDNGNVIFVSAPGKVILHGEHAVVYGKTALATSVNLRTFLRLTSTDEREVKLSLPNIGLNHSWDINELEEKFADVLGKDCHQPTIDELEHLKTVDGYVEEDGTKGLALIAFLYLYMSIMGRKKLQGCEVLVVSQLPTGAGLGSSAAFSVCVAGALLHHVGEIAPQPCFKSERKLLSQSNLDVINKWAFEGERIIHGNPSGIDNSVSVFGGVLRFQNQPKVNITPIKNMPKLRILLINTKVPRSTKELVAGVRRKLDKYPSIINPVIQAVGNLALTCESILQEMSDTYSDNYFIQLEELVDMNQHFLSIMGVSHPTLQQICLLTSQYGLHSKLTGAGGGGCALTLLRPDTPAHSVEAICRKLHDYGFDAWETCVGGVGVVCNESHADLLQDGFTVPAKILQTL